MPVFIILMLTIGLLCILISHFIFKRHLNIEEKRIHPFSKNRKKLFLTLEVITIIIFIVISIFYTNNVDPPQYSLTFLPKLSIIVLFTVQVIRGIELWIFNRKEKSYYYQFLGAITHLIFLLVLCFSDVYLF